MLDGLDQIPWSQLSHAYGPATDVPELIRRLAAGSIEEREAALSELYGTIWHQGTVYEATPYAVPFLIELVTDPAIPDRCHILSLLQAIAEGWVNCQKYAAQPGKFVPAASVERRAIERRHYQAAHAAVAQHLTALSELLNDDEAEVRVWAAFVLLLLTEHAAEIAAGLLDAINRDADECCRAALQFALVQLVKNTASPVLTDVAVRRLTSVFDAPPSKVVALGAGIALLELGQEAALPRVLDLARAQLLQDNHVFETVCWPGASTVYSLVNSSLKFAPREQLKWIIEGLHHTDREVRSAAIGFGDVLCETFRWGSDELLSHYVKLVESPDAEDRKMSLCRMRSMGAAGAEYLASFQHHRLADVRDMVAVQLKPIEFGRKERESWLAEPRATPLPPVATLLETIDRHQGSRKWDDEQKLRDAVINLGFHGPHALQAVETIRTLTERDNPWTRVHAIRALWRITHDADLVVPLLQANLNPDQQSFLVLDCLQQIGSAARSMAPELHQILDSERRYFPPHWGDTCGADEAFCDACAATLRAIGGTG